MGLEVLYGIGAVILLGALIWAVNWNRHRNRANDLVTERAVREEYKDPAHYPEKRNELKKEVRPS